MTTTATTSTKPKTPRARPADRCRLTLHVRGVAYGVRPLAGGEGRAFRLAKADGTAYDVAETPYGPTCDCADQVFRHEGRDGRGCKHIRACRALGLIADR
jgi:hypothetical protein